MEPLHAKHLLLAILALLLSLCNATLPTTATGPITERPAALPRNAHTSTSSGTLTSRTPGVGQPRANIGSVATEHNGPLNLVISKSGGNQSSDLLYGVMLEDIDHSVDGGLYAELVRNRAFQEGNLDSWSSVGGASMSLASLDPVSTALPQYLQITVSRQGMGIENTGWWGFYVAPQDYRVSIWAKSSSTESSPIKVALVSAKDRTEWASATFNIDSSQWKNYQTVISPTSSAPDNHNLFVITTENSTTATLDFAFLSLFPPTFNDRPNGVRPDLMNHILDLKPTFCRILSGNNMEGETISKRWIWNNTIGPLIDRRGRMGSWGYYNTNGMGLLEYMEFCEDLGAEWLVGVYAGYSLQHQSVPENDIQPFVDAALGQIEYLVGPADSTYGRLRVQDGRVEPFDLKYVEIGNEDFYSQTYWYRFPAYYNALSSAYPNITFVATTPYGIKFPKGVVWDQHYYQDPEQFQGLYNAYDNWPRGNGTNIIVGEYADQQFDNLSYTKWSFTEGSISEFAFSLGIERNADVVKSQMWAPILANVNYLAEGRPRLITFNNAPAETILSTSYHMLQLLSQSHGPGFQTLPVQANIDTYPLYWMASLDPTSEIIYVKIANAGNDSQQVKIGGDGFSLEQASASMLAGPELAANKVENPTLVLPSNLVAQSSCGQVSFTMQSWSAAVVQLKSSNSTCGSKSEGFSQIYPNLVFSYIMCICTLILINGLYVNS